MICLVFPSLATAKIPIGMNIQEVSYWNEGQLFTDIMKSAQEVLWFANGEWRSSGDGASYDSSGYPTQVPQTINSESKNVRILFNTYADEDYVMLFDGTGHITVSGCVTTSSASNRIALTCASGGNKYFDITSSQLGDNVRNIRIIPDEYEGNEASMPTFVPEFTQGLEPFSVIRFMDFTRTNTSEVEEWDDRVLKTSFIQGSEIGTSWGYAVELANQLNADMWMNVPYLASDDYITQLATYLKSNLNSGLKIYLEYSNELWNGTFKANVWLNNNAPDHPNSYVTTDIVALDDSLGSGNWNIPEKMGYMFARSFRLFDAVYGSEMDSRVIRVGATWLTLTNTSNRMMNHLFNVDGIGADALAPSGYFNFSPTNRANLNAKEDATPGSVTVQGVLDEAWDNIVTNNAQTAAQAGVAQSYGVDLITYEAGQHHDQRDEDNQGWVQELYDAQVAQGMYDLYINRLQNHEDNNCKLFTAFTYVGLRENKHGSFGHLESYDQLNLTPTEMKAQVPKYQALLDFIGEGNYSPIIKQLDLLSAK